MASPLRRAIVLALALAACKSSQQEDNQPRRADPGLRAEEKKKPERPPVWQREATPIPEAFARFPVAPLDSLIGTWVVASDVPGERELWIIEEQGRKLTTVDARGRERVHALSLQSPCSLTLIDEGGRTRTRRFAPIGDRFHTHPEGASAVAAPDGSVLACVDTQTIVMPVEGPCVGHGEMLGVWSELGPPAGTCAREVPEIVIGERRLRPVEGIWMDEVLQQAVAEKVADRAAGEQLLAKPAG
jgi:hypothetical protein